MHARSRVSEVLYDSETILRLVDREMEELREDKPEELAQAGNLAVLLAVMQAASDQITGILFTLRASREVLHDATLQEIHDSTAKLDEVSSATQLAAANIMDGLERAHALVGKLDQLGEPVAEGEAGGHDVEAATVREELHDELFSLMGSLQFQDITAQQLGHVGQMLREVERRLRETSELLDGGRLEAAAGVEVPRTFSESASTLNVIERQAAADAIFWRTSAGAGAIPSSRIA